MADPGSGYGGPDSDSQAAGAAMGAADAAAAASGFNDDAGQGGAAPAGSSASPAGYAAGADRGFFGGIMDYARANPVGLGLSALGMLTGMPALSMMGTLAQVGKAASDQFGGTVSAPSQDMGGDGPDRAQVQQTVPTFNPIEDMVGSEYVAYGGVGADQLRKQLFPYMNFNQPTQPGISGLVGQYAGAGQGTGLMTGPFGMSNTQV